MKPLDQWEGGRMDPQYPWGGFGMDPLDPWVGERDEALILLGRVGDETLRPMGKGEG